MQTSTSTHPQRSSWSILAIVLVAVAAAGAMFVGLLFAGALFLGAAHVSPDHPSLHSGPQPAAPAAGEER